MSLRHYLLILIITILFGSAYPVQKVIFNDKKNNWKLILPISGNKFQEPTPLFEKLEEEKVLAENGIISDEQ